MSDETLIRVILRLLHKDVEIPPTSYEWFGLRQFEEDLEVIEKACDKLLGELQRVISSKRANIPEDTKDVARELMNLSIRKQHVLLDPAKKAKYDAALKREMEYWDYMQSASQPKAEAKKSDMWPPEEVQVPAPATNEEEQEESAKPSSEKKEDKLEIQVKARPKKGAEMGTTSSDETVKRARRQAAYLQRQRALKFKIAFVVLGGVAGIVLALLIIRVLQS